MAETAALHSKPPLHRTAAGGEGCEDREEAGVLAEVAAESSEQRKSPWGAAESEARASGYVPMRGLQHSRLGVEFDRFLLALVDKARRAHKDSRYPHRSFPGFRGW